MGQLVTKLLKLANAVTTQTHIEGPRLPESLEDGNTLYDHRMLSIEEEAVNRKMRSVVRNHWFFHSIIFEFEPNNKVFMNVITKLGNVINVEFDVDDIWFDDYTSTIQIKVDVANVDMGGLFLNIITHLFGNWSLHVLGMFFNPFSIDDDTSSMRLEKKGIIRFDLSPNSTIRQFIPWPQRSKESVGPVLLTGIKSGQSVLQVEYYAFHQKLETYSAPEMPVKTNWVRSIDMAAALLMPIGVWVSFIILNHYLPHEELQDFSFSTYFFISLSILLFSFIVMNIPRYIYMYFETRKKWQSVFVSNNIKIQMRRLQRRIAMQKQALENDKNVVKRQEHIVEMLMQIRDKRFLAHRLKVADEDRDRKQKVKFIIAYVLCTFLEWMLLIH
ncbi:hypothetical protein [Veillonella sp. VA142]|uniref:hypothetical protein n=1 Tax=Veillonella sp. VA142 TaxID=741834 RepID=UPI000F8D91CA|nr:hypothetical protein [Veillonella sp. VA142]